MKIRDNDSIKYANDINRIQVIKNLFILFLIFDFYNFQNTSIDIRKQIKIKNSFGMDKHHWI